MWTINHLTINRRALYSLRSWRCSSAPPRRTWAVLWSSCSAPGWRLQTSYVPKFPKCNFGLTFGMKNGLSFDLRLIFRMNPAPDIHYQMLSTLTRQSGFSNWCSMFYFTRRSGGPAPPSAGGSTPTRRRRWGPSPPSTTPTDSPGDTSGSVRWSTGQCS